MDQPAKVYTVKTVLSDFFQGNLSESKLREMVRKNQIPHFRIGAKILFRKDSFDEWVKAQEKKQEQNRQLVNRLTVIRG